jgi:hypothetical protein
MSAASPAIPPKAEKAAPPKKAASGEKKERAPRQDYGFAADATIKLTDGEKTYRGKRGAMYEQLKKSAGKPVQHFLDNNKNEKDPPRGWLRFFVQDEACNLEGGTKKEEVPAKKASA